LRNYYKGNFIKQFIIKALILFYLFSSFVHGTHFHNETDEHMDDCKICTIVSLFKTIPPIKSLMECDANACHESIEIFLHKECIEKTPLKGYLSHAPPFLS